MTKVATKAALLFTVLSGTTASTADLVAFDVPGGSYRELFAGELGEGTRIDCMFEIKESYEDEEWRPFVGILLSSEDPDGEDEFGLILRLHAGPIPDDKMFWRHGLDISAENELRADITAYTGTSLQPQQMQVIWLENGSFTYLVGNDWENASWLDVSHLHLQTWSVNVSGVKGAADCRVYLPDRDAPEPDPSNE